MNMKNILFCISAMFATATFAEEYFENFQGEGSFDSWGEVSITNETIVTTAFGVPGGRTHDGDKVLSIEGVATNGTMFSSVAMAAQVDLLVKVAVPDDELEIPADDEGNVQIAVAVDASTNLVVYCKTNDTNAGFCTVTTSPLVGEWIRVSLNFDYEHGRCQVLKNGEICTSEYGYITATNDVKGGAWYKLAKDSEGSASKPNLLKIVGTTAIDDVYGAQKSASDGIVIDNTVADATATVTIDGNNVDVNVSKAWLYTNNVSTAQMNVTATDGSDMTIGQKYVCGLEANDGKKFALSDMQPAGNNKMRFIVPGEGARGGYTFKLNASTNPTTGYSAIESAEFSGTSVELDLSTELSSGNVKYFRVNAVKERFD